VIVVVACTPIGITSQGPRCHVLGAVGRISVTLEWNGNRKCELVFRLLTVKNDALKMVTYMPKRTDPIRP
jgi:hypothetical protein